MAAGLSLTTPGPFVWSDRNVRFKPAPLYTTWGSWANGQVLRLAINGLWPRTWQSSARNGPEVGPGDADPLAVGQTGGRNYAWEALPAVRPHARPNQTVLNASPKGARRPQPPPTATLVVRRRVMTEFQLPPGPLAVYWSGRQDVTAAFEPQTGVGLVWMGVQHKLIPGADRALLWHTRSSESPTWGRQPRSGLITAFYRGLLTTAHQRAAWHPRVA
jgi:hypothetical protein